MSTSGPLVQSTFALALLNRQVWLLDNVYAARFQSIAVCDP
jgi:hypothetical protein